LSAFGLGLLSGCLLVRWQKVFGQKTKLETLDILVVIDDAAERIDRQEYERIAASRMFF
jgi:hypothetical protein